MCIRDSPKTPYTSMIRESFVLLKHWVLRLCRRPFESLKLFLRIPLASIDARKNLESEPDRTDEEGLVVVALEGPHLPVSELALLVGLVRVEVRSSVLVVLSL